MIKKAALFVIFLLVPLGIWLSQRGRCGFDVAKISSNLSYHAEWDTSSTSIDLQIFDQPFTYLGKGIQCYVFVSSDGSYVLKFFKYHHMKPSYKKGKKQRPELEKDFNSYKMSFEELSEETGVLYVHLNKTKYLNKLVKLTDKSGRSHLVDLDKTEFVLQRRGNLVYPSLNQWMEKAEVDMAKCAIDSILKVLVDCSKKGIRDEDPVISRNFALIGTQAVIIDIGSFNRDESRSNPVVYGQDLLVVTTPFKKWLNDRHPILAQHLEERVQEVLRTDTFSQ